MINWSHWHNEPLLIGGLILAAWLYALFTGPLRATIDPQVSYPRKAGFFYYTGLILFYLAVGSPLDQIGERFLFSVHMVQHQLLMYPIPILVLLGIPVWLGNAIKNRLHLRRVGAFFLHPAIAGLLTVLVISIWHIPALYDWALQDRNVHIIEHLTTFAVSLLFWHPVLGIGEAKPTVRPPLQMLYLIAVTIGFTPLFAYLAFSKDILYPTYEFAPRIITDFTAAQDQFLGAAMMKLGGMLVTFIALIWVFYRWYQDSEKRS